MSNFKSYSTSKIRLLKLSSFFAVLTLFFFGNKTLSDDYKLETLPSLKLLKTIQLKAYDCARKNNEDSCLETQNLVNPLMDNKLLSISCKDTIWTLLMNAKKSSVNDLNRVNSIESPAMKLTTICLKKDKKQGSPRGGLRKNSQTRT